MVKKAKLVSVEEYELSDGAEDVTPADSVVPVYYIPETPKQIADRKAWEAGAYDREVEAVKQARHAAYQAESDPLFFGWQRGENTEQEWLDAVQAVKDANPYPVKDNPV